MQTIGDTLIFLREYAAENAAMDGRLQSENPRIIEALRKISARERYPVMALANSAARSCS